MRAWAAFSAVLLATGLTGFASVSAASAAPTPPAVGPDWSYGAAAATQLSQLPILSPTVVGAGQSSYDRNTGDKTNGNTDFNHFLATGPRGNVMLDQEGPGCVYRIWMTSLQSYFPSEWVHIYFDGQSRPAISMTIGQMFSGLYAPFLSPLVQGPAASSGGYVSYVPLCYHTSIEITTNMDRYYDIGYVTYAPNANVQTWTPGTSTASMQSEWTNATSDPIPASGNTTVSGTISLGAGKNQALATLSGPSSVQAIKINIPGVTASSGAAAASVLNQLWIQIRWDGEKTPSVYAPLGSFFAMGQFGAYPTHALVAGMDASNYMYMYLPMPFQRRAVIRLVNNGTTSVPGINYIVQYRPYGGNFSQTGYFSTSFIKGSNVRVGRDIPILNTTGSGKFVGVTASYAGDPQRLYLEGDERIYVDGSGSPAFYGTGTEDFFNGAFYFLNGPYSQPMSGNTAHIATATSDETAAYRFFLQDAIPFRRSIVVEIQHGPYDNTTNTSASMLAYYYKRPAVQSTLTSTLAVGNVGSDRAHGYVISDQVWQGKHTYTYPGTADNVNITDHGRADRGYSQFTMTIARNNQGVDLRRRFDHSIANQAAKVYVNGRLVGLWYVAGANAYHQWADSDYVIPAAYTRNKTSITIKIKYVAGSRYWTEYRYWAYSLVP
ncbi:MAG TPA: glycoside hydrolase family 172 protein [Streptosporangiaceae bacterium]|nr:glycoside hydrolase family 172 protein [Streptosporangiaceae bacterium]